MPYIAFLDLLEKAEVIKAEEDYRMYCAVGAILDEKASTEMIQKLNSKRDSVLIKEELADKLTPEQISQNTSLLKSLFRRGK